MNAAAIAGHEAATGHRMKYQTNVEADRPSRMPIAPPNVSERSLRDLGPTYSTGPEAFLREWFCVSCGAQMDARVVRRGDSLPVDIVECA